MAHVNSSSGPNFTLSNHHGNDYVCECLICLYNPLYHFWVIVIKTQGSDDHKSVIQCSGMHKNTTSHATLNCHWNCISQLCQVRVTLCQQQCGPSLAIRDPCGSTTVCSKIKQAFALLLVRYCCSYVTVGTTQHTIALTAS